MFPPPASSNTLAPMAGTHRTLLEDRGVHAASITRPWKWSVLTAALWLTTTAATAADPTPVRPEVSGPVDFERHVMGLFGKMGCNSGSCHGSFQGKGGFRLSLFGYDPAKDYVALTRELQGRRVNSVDPDQSLLLLKATGQVEHGGGRRFGKDSWQYQMFRRWVADGATWKKGSGEATGIVITPPVLTFKKAGETAAITVKAKFSDGAEEDITALCDFRVNDDAVAEMAGPGAVKALRPGDTPVVVSYRGNVLPVRVMVPQEMRAGIPYPKIPEVNAIDREVFAKLKSLNIIPSDLASDAEFLRRVTIDTIGSLPTPDDVRAFLADTTSDKRARKIDELLAHPRHAALWATKLCDITGNNTDALEQPVPLKPKRSQMWHDWLRKRMQDNTPYDEIVGGILTATSRDGQAVDDWIKQVAAIDEQMAKSFDAPYAERKSLDLFWRRQQQVPVEQWGEKTAAAFMGIRLECAQCHKHPFDRWTQADYRGYANVFGQIRFDNQSPESRQAIAAENKRRGGAQRGNQQNQVREVYTGQRRPPLSHPDTGAPLSPKALGGPELDTTGAKDARVALFEWLRTPDNPFFARSFVNRIWGHYFGLGIVEPVDDFSLANPPSNEKLLDALAQLFVESKFDIRHIERAILNSRTYQLSSKPNETNKLDRKNFSHSFVRPMMAEVVVDVLNDALGTTETFGNDVRPGSRGIDIGASRIQNANLNYIFRIFGRSPRTAACDCERALEPALPQKLFLMTDQNILNKLNQGRASELARSEKSDEQVLEELFLAVLGRYPTEADKSLFASYRAAKNDRRTVLVDTLWALINTREFILNH